MRRPCLLLVALLAASPALLADVRLPAILGDHMALQADRPIHLWGWADPGEEVTARFNGTRASTDAGAHGHWSLYLPPQQAGGPYTLEIEGRNSLELEDVLVGDVWIASGQSNMVWEVDQSNYAEQEIDSADYPQMRLFEVELDTAPRRQQDLEGRWVVCSPETVGDFSAVAYSFGRHLHEKTGRPMGLIQSAWGGTPAEAWTTRETLDADAELHRFLAEWYGVVAEHPRAMARHERALEEWQVEAEAARKAGREPERKPRAPRGPGHQHEPAGLFNAMIAPLTPLAIRGAIWYQGENNANRPDGGPRYRRLFRTMIEDWRREWGIGDFPFLFVQLANYSRVRDDSTWPELREAQTHALGLRNTGMAVTIDIGESDDIHPKNKQEVGRRLALAARAISYDEEELTYSGPIFRQATHEAGKVRLWFDHVGNGLKARKSSLDGFTIAGPDGEFHDAEAVIEGDTVLVSHPDIDMPVAVRYAWSADPHEANLVNSAGLPASPFRTDDWR